MKFEDKIKLAVEMAHYRIEQSKLSSPGGAAINTLASQALPKNSANHEDDYVFTVWAMANLIDSLEVKHNSKDKSKS